MPFPALTLSVLVTAAAALVAGWRLGRYALAAAVATGIIVVLHGVVYFHYTPDDAYISLRYAHNLASGDGLVWNPGEHVEGYTNFLWVVTLAAFDAAGADPAASGRWLGVALAIGAGLLAWHLAAALLEGPAGRLAGLVAALLLAASGSWALWAASSLETPLFGALITAAVVLHIREADRPNAIPWSGAVWALVAMTRPDGLVLVAVSAAFKAGEAYARGRLVADDGAPPGALALRDLRGVGLWLAAFLVIYVPYFAWRYATYGWLFPNTYYAKVGSGFDQWERGLDYLLQFSRESGAWLLAGVPLAIAVTRLRRAPALYAMAITVAWFAYVGYVGGDALARFRFFAPILPLMYAILAASGAALIERALAGDPLQARQRWLFQAAIGAAVLAAVAFTLSASATSPLFQSERAATAERREIGRWLRDTMPESTTIALPPAGAIPYESRLPAIDMHGLNDEHIAHRDLPLGAGAAGHEKYDTTYVLDRRPEIIILQDRITSGPWEFEDYSRLAFAATTARLDMLANERFAREYEARSVELRPSAWFNFFVRRDAGLPLP